MWGTIFHGKTRIEEVKVGQEETEREGRQAEQFKYLAEKGSETPGKTQYGVYTPKECLKP